MTDHTPTSDPLDIALLAPLVSPIRQPFLGGAQALLADLATGLARRGHTVTLYASQGSDADTLPGVTLVEVVVDEARVRPTDFAALSATQAAPPVNSAVEDAFTSAFAHIAARAPRHQVMHAHAYDEPAFRLAQRLPMPVAHTLHMSAVDSNVLHALTALAPTGRSREGAQPWLVTVSQAAAATYRDICHIDAVIYNGIDVAAIPFGAASATERYALYAGRITPEKGVVDAIQIALEAGVRLVLVGGIYDQRYYDEGVAPLLAAHPTQLTYLGPLPREEVWRLMAGASAALVPSLWDEPFGLAPCEAQAAGAPVIGYESGGLREVIAQGDTGTLVPRGHIAEAARALAQVAQFQRAACRRRVETLFSLDTTISGYEALYRRMLLTL